MRQIGNYEIVHKPWGSFERFTLNEPSTVKIITVRPNQALSLQQHEHRDEEWKILSGSGAVTVGETRTEVHPGEEFFIGRGQHHRVEGGPLGVVFLEVASGDFDEADIKRLGDRYGRA